MGLIPTGCLIRSSDRCLRHVLGNRFSRSVFPCKKCGNTCESVLSLTQVEFYQYLTEVTLLLLLSPRPAPWHLFFPYFLLPFFLFPFFSSFFLHWELNLRPCSKLKTILLLSHMPSPCILKQNLTIRLGLVLNPMKLRLTSS